MSTEAPAAPEQPKTLPTAGERFAAKLAAAPEVTPEVPAPPPPTSETPPETPAAEPVGTPAETTEVVETPSFIEQAKALGFENLTEEDAQQRVLAYAAQVQAEAAQLREHNARLEAERQQLLALRQQAAPVSTQTAEAPKPWVPPSIDRNLIAEYREAKIDPTSGKQTSVWKEGTPAEVRLQVERFEQWQKSWAEALTTRPHEVLTDMVKQIAAEVATQQYTAQAQTREVESFKAQVLKDNPWLYEQNPLTKAPTDKLSAEGQRMYQWCQEAVEAGVIDPRKQWAYAERERRIAQLEAKEKATTTTQNVAQINAQKKQATLEASLAAKGLNAPVNNIPPPRSKDRPLTAGQRFAQKLAAEGVPT